MPSLPRRVGNVELESRRMFVNVLKAKNCCMLLARAALVVAALPMTARAATSPDRVQLLVRETATQFQIAYRLYPSERQRRQEQLNAAVVAWRAAPRTDANNERFATWLRATIRASMPGSREALPPTPTFTLAIEKETRPAAPRATPEPTLAAPPVKEPTPADASVADPFRDDPAGEQE
jgi:hypothetical protein